MMENKYRDDVLLTATVDTDEWIRIKMYNRAVGRTGRIFFKREEMDAALEYGLAIHDCGDFLKISRNGDDILLRAVFTSCGGNCYGRCMNVATSVPVAVWGDLVENGGTVLTRPTERRMATIDWKNAGMHRFKGKNGRRMIRKAYKCMAEHFIVPYSCEVTIYNGGGKDFEFVESRSPFTGYSGGIIYSEYEVNGHPHKVYNCHT